MQCYGFLIYGSLLHGHQGGRGTQVSAPRFDLVILWMLSAHASCYLSAIADPTTWLNSDAKHNGSTASTIMDMT